MPRVLEKCRVKAKPCRQDGTPKGQAHRNISMPPALINFLLHTSTILRHAASPSGALSERDPPREPLISCCSLEALSET